MVIYWPIQQKQLVSIMAEKLYTALTRPGTKLIHNNKVYHTGEVVPVGLSAQFGSSHKTEAAAQKAIDAHNARVAKAVAKLEKRKS